MKANLSRVVRRGVLAAAMTAAFASSAFALPQFTLNPTASGEFTGAPVTADNVIISNYSTVKFAPDGSGNFEERGFLSVQSFQLGGTVVSTPDLNSTYSLYIDFTARGNQELGTPTPTNPLGGTFSLLEYTLYGVEGTTEFGFGPDHDVTLFTPGDPDGPTTLATGSLLSGGPFVTVGGPGAIANVTFSAIKLPFFASPDPFYISATSSFVNDNSQVTSFENGFSIEKGGGSFHFEGAAAPIPEPQTYALMLAGLAAMGFVVRRRSGT